MVVVRYFAGVRAAAGVAEEKVEAATLGALLAALTHDHGPAFGRVLGAASYLLDEVSVRDAATVLPDGATVDVLPPFAGG